MGLSSKTILIVLLVLAIVGLAVLAWVQAKFLLITLALLALCLGALVYTVRQL